jgi:hypothetical protein
MRATPNSSTDKVKSAEKKASFTAADEVIMGMEHKSSSKCPAIILAAKRMARVNGRITDLISSIKTITGTKTAGVPKGTRWAKKEDLFFKKKEIIYPTHILSLIHLVKTM